MLGLKLQMLVSQEFLDCLLDCLPILFLYMVECVVLIVRKNNVSGTVLNKGTNRCQLVASYTSVWLRSMMPVLLRQSPDCARCRWRGRTSRRPSKKKSEMRSASIARRAIYSGRQLRCIFDEANLRCTKLVTFSQGEILSRDPT